MSEELKACPFCGRNPISNEDGFVKCSYGGCGFEESLFYKNWNTRPLEDALQKRIEELKPELATRYEELLNMINMEVDQFNDGFNDARAGKLEIDHPHYDFDTDNWRLGYAWGMFEPMKEKLARERQVSDALYLLLVDDPNTKLKADQILIDIYGKCEPSTSDVSTTQDVTTPEPPEVQQ